MIKEIFNITKNYQTLSTSQNLLNISQSNIKYGIEFKDRLVLPKKEFLVSLEGKKNLDFALDDLKIILEKIKFKSNISYIPFNSKFHYSKIKITKGYTDPKQKYIRYLSIILNKFVIDTQKKTITNFSNFFKEFSEYIKTNINLFTFIKFIKSNNISFFSSGLVYSIFDEKDNDLSVATSYLEDAYFNIFQDICLMNNYIIDSYMPWVIIRRVDDSFIEQNKLKYENIYETELNFIHESFKSLYLMYVENILNEEDKDLADITHMSLNYNSFIDFYVFIKIKESSEGINIIEDFNLIKNFFLINSSKNGLADSIKKISEIGVKHDSIYQDFRSLYL